MGFLDLFKIKQIKSENEKYLIEIDTLKKQMHDSGITEYYQAQQKLNQINKDIDNSTQTLNLTKKDLSDTYEKLEKNKKQLTTNIKKLTRAKDLYKSIEYTIEKFSYESFNNNLLNSQENQELDDLSPSVILNLHSMDTKDLRKAYKENEKNINKILDSYAARYTTKANKTIYALMVIALRAELQNILYNLKYSKLDESIDDVKKVTDKYLKIAQDGNQQLSSTLQKFIGEIEFLFINAVKIEYNYYVRKEQAKQEQLALRQQMREEAEERKLLEQQQKQIEKEEQKYHSELTKIKEMLLSADIDKQNELNNRILELENQLTQVIVKKDEITKLQNGKAGNVYIISNLGSFGENMFKVGMTRRIDPIDRINELGSASVPFRFDIHSLIFSNDAVALESKLHELLKDNRVNKVNLRKEFFSISIDELEELVNNIDSTAEFTKTMLAEEFRQSISSEEIYGETTNFYDDEDDD